MSITIDYFFNCPADLATVAERVNSAIGCDLRPFQKDQREFFCPFFFMDLELKRHSLENDRELNFEDYEYHLSLRNAAGAARARPLQIPTIVAIVYALHLHSRIVGMLVFDVQILLARYGSRTDPGDGSDALHDAVSDELVRLPSHFSTLITRVPEESRDVFI